MRRRLLPPPGTGWRGVDQGGGRDCFGLPWGVGIPGGGGLRHPLGDVSQRLTTNDPCVASWPGAKPRPPWPWDASPPRPGQSPASPETGGDLADGQGLGTHMCGGGGPPQPAGPGHCGRPLPRCAAPSGCAASGSACGSRTSAGCLRAGGGGTVPSHSRQLGAGNCV